MKIFISDDGDRESNIPITTAIIDVNLVNADYNKNDRDYIREKLGETFKGLFDLHGKMFVIFDDECPNCLTVLQKGKCQNVNCRGF